MNLSTFRLSLKKGFEQPKEILCSTYFELDKNILDLLT